MKKLILLAGISISLLNVANAQRKGLWLAPMSQIGAAMDNYGNTVPTVSLGIGLDATYFFTDKVGLGTGISYQLFGQDAYFDAIQIPLLFRFVSSKHTGFALNAGFAYGKFVTEHWGYDEEYISFLTSFGMRFKGNKVDVFLGPEINYQLSTEMLNLSMKFSIGIHTVKVNKQRVTE